MGALRSNRIDCKKMFFAVFGLVSTFLNNNAAALSITVNKMECVSENVAFPGDVVYGNFVVIANSILWNRQKQLGVEFTVRSPSGNVVFELKRSSGDKYEFRAPKQGTYKFCFKNPNPVPEIVSFHIQTGHIPNPIDKATDENFNPLNVRLAELRQALDVVTAEQKYLKAEESGHRRSSEITRSRLFSYTVMEYILLGIMSGVQILVIRHFFAKSIAYNIVG
ncbi:hypothetical protein V2J09_015579 [Rumex salicifolius]